MDIHPLQLATNALAQWTTKNGLTQNPSKCQAILFSWTKKLPSRTPPLQILGKTIPWSDSAKYLGIENSSGESTTKLLHTKCTRESASFTPFSDANHSVKKQKQLSINNVFAVQVSTLAAHGQPPSKTGLTPTIKLKITLLELHKNQQGERTLTM